MLKKYKKWPRINITYDRNWEFNESGKIKTNIEYYDDMYNEEQKYHIIIVKKNNETIEKNFEEPTPITKLRFCLCMYNDYDLDEDNEIDYIIVE